MSRLLRALLQPPRAPVAWPVWALLALLGALATALYWLSPGQERLEVWLQLPPPPTLPAEWLPTLIDWRDRAPDVVWALLAGCCMRDLIWSLRLPVAGIAVVLAAVGWELGQWLYFLPGHFDLVDLALSAAAGGIALVVPSQGDVP